METKELEIRAEAARYRWLISQGIIHVFADYSNRYIELGVWNFTRRISTGVPDPMTSIGDAIDEFIRIDATLPKAKS